MILTRLDWRHSDRISLVLTCPVCAELTRKCERMEWLYAIALRNLHYGHTDYREVLRHSADDARDRAIEALNALETNQLSHEITRR